MCTGTAGLEKVGVERKGGFGKGGCKEGVAANAQAIGENIYDSRHLLR